VTREDKLAGMWFVLFLIFTVNNFWNVIFVCYNISKSSAGWLDFYRTMAFLEGFYITYQEVKKEMSRGDNYLV
jgi:hypothetical protein